MRAPRKVDLEEEDRRDYRRSRGGSAAFPLYSEQEVVRDRTPPPPGERSIRLHVVRPGCGGKAGREAIPLQPAETRRRQVPCEDRVLVA